MCSSDWWEGYRTGTPDIFSSWLIYIYIYIYMYICVLVTGGKDTGLKPRIADLVPGSWAQRSNVLCAGDIMLNLNGKECSNMMQHQIGK